MKVLIVQPTVPHYRTAFFNGVARQLDAPLEIQASARIPGGPDSVDAAELPGIRYNPFHRLRTLGNNKLYWQDGLDLGEMGRGDVLFVAGNPRFLSLFPLIFKARLRGMGVIMQGHGWSSTSHPLLARLRHALWRTGHVLFLYTDEERTQFIANGYAPAQVFAANNTIGTDDIENARAAWTPQRLEQFQHDNGLTQGVPTILFCGRLTRKAELHILLEALAYLRDHDRHVKLVAIGTGEEEASLRARCKELTLDDRVSWIGAEHDEMRLAPWFMSAQLFVYPGAIGLSLLHAFNYGLPVVTHDRIRQHNPEIAALEPEVNGALFAHGDANALAGCIARLLDQDNALQQMSARARQTVEQRFSTSIMVQRFMSAVQAAHRMALGLPPLETS